MWTVIFSIIGMIVIGFVILFIRGMSKMERKESLLILTHKDSIEIALTDDKYYEFDISDISNENDKVYERLKNVIKQKAVNLSGYNIIDVKFFKNSDGTIDQSKELYTIIDNERKTAA
jgi:hypothetical protein